ncbi:hypothetical protein ACWD4G_36660 [Streptomyces sp. NPDC002643]
MPIRGPEELAAFACPAAEHSAAWFAYLTSQLAAEPATPAP